VQFNIQNQVNVLRGITICISTAPFSKLADPGLQCATNAYRDTDGDPLYFDMPAETEEKPYWAAVYCVSDKTCSFELSRVSGDGTSGGLSTGAIIGIVIGVLVVVAIVTFVVVYCVCRSSSKQKERHTSF
jgi:hypothetical protein